MMRHKTGVVRWRLKSVKIPKGSVRIKNRLDADWRRIYSVMARDSVRLSLPRAFLSTLTLFFHHVSDAMAGDDRPDHGLAKMREGREYYRIPFRLLYGKLKRFEKKMTGSHYRKTLQLFHKYMEGISVPGDKPEGSDTKDGGLKEIK